MIQTTPQMPHTTLENEQGGRGVLNVFEVFPPAAFGGRIRMCKRFVFQPGDSIGPHTHRGEVELYYVLRGTATVTEDGAVHRLTAGDAALCQDGHTHSISNDTDQVMEILAIIV